jgi:hypothetical protein
MKNFVIYKINLDKLIAMGVWQGNTKQQAINNMAKSGNLVGAEFESNYFAIPSSTLRKHYTPKIK